MDGTGAKYRKASTHDVTDGVKTVASPETERRMVLTRDWGRSGDLGHWVLRNKFYCISMLRIRKSWEKGF